MYDIRIHVWKQKNVVEFEAKLVLHSTEGDTYNESGPLLSVSQKSQFVIKNFVESWHREIYIRESFRKIGQPYWEDC